MYKLYRSIHLRGLEILKNYTGKNGEFGPVKLKAESGHACLVP